MQVQNADDEVELPVFEREDFGVCGEGLVFRGLRCDGRRDVASKKIFDGFFCVCVFETRAPTPDFEGFVEGFIQCLNSIGDFFARIPVKGRTKKIVLRECLPPRLYALCVEDLRHAHICLFKNPMPNCMCMSTKNARYLSWCWQAGLHLLGSSALFYRAFAFKFLNVASVVLSMQVHMFM